MKILIVNDDSIDSPFLQLLLEQLPNDADINIVVPAKEQSWKGKAMTRFGQLAAQKVNLNGYVVTTIEGTPADCANIGIYLHEEGRPDVVVSGINIGHNSGVSYVFSSGTVGAALEANIAGIPALALSQELPNALFNEWVETRSFSEQSLQYFRQQLSQAFPSVWAAFLERLQRGDAVTWSVNFPGRLLESWQLKPTLCGHSYYGQCFVAQAGSFSHAGPHGIEDQREDSDIHVLRQGHVSLTEFDIRQFGQVKPSL